MTSGVSDGLPPLRDIIAAHGLRADKKFGQNFILDLNLTRRIARAALPLDDTPIIEIGPGPGGLTRGLLMEGARKIIAIEADRRFIPALDDIGRLSGSAGHYQWRCHVPVAVAIGRWQVQNHIQPAL